LKQANENELLLAKIKAGSDENSKKADKTAHQKDDSKKERAKAVKSRTSESESDDGGIISKYSQLNIQIKLSKLNNEIINKDQKEFNKKLRDYLEKALDKDFYGELGNLLKTKHAKHARRIRGNAIMTIRNYFS
jgi:hypothetical protein